MADQVNAKMLRGIGGFAEGDTRILDRGDAKRLEARGVLKILGDAKAEKAPRNQAEPTAANKAITTSPAAKVARKRAR